MYRVTYFEIMAQDANRAMGFYYNCFGWQFAQMGEEPYWLIKTGDDSFPGIDGGMQLGPPIPPGQPINAFVCYITTPNINDSIARVQYYGGALRVQPHMVPGLGWRAYCTDSEGNLIVLVQETGEGEETDEADEAAETDEAAEPSEE